MDMADEAPGWNAIDAAIGPVVGDVVPLHWGTNTGLPQQDGLWGISAYALAEHWFFVTYGLSELFTKVSDDPAVSGYGEELTFRLLRSGETDPPAWASKLLARLGELVYERRTPFLPGGRLELQGTDEAPPALCWAADPEMRAIETPFGSVQFVATIGCSPTLLAEMRESSTDAVLSSVRPENPLLISGGAGLTW